MFSIETNKLPTYIFWGSQAFIVGVSSLDAVFML